MAAELQERELASRDLMDFASRFLKFLNALLLKRKKKYICLVLRPSVCDKPDVLSKWCVFDLVVRLPRLKTHLYDSPCGRTPLLCTLANTVGRVYEICDCETGGDDCVF